MKFTNGYWKMKKNIEPRYAIEYFDHRIENNELTIYAATRHIEGRGSSVQVPLIIIKLSSVRENIIKVDIVNYEGELEKGPFVNINKEEINVEIEEHNEKLVFTTGKLKAEIDKRASSWGISYYENGRFLTDTRYRNIAYIKDIKAKKQFTVEQLKLDIDEKIYGLGERFTPFVKNGQSVEIWNEDGGTASEKAYKNIPFYISNKGYGVLVNNQGRVEYEIGSEKVERVQMSVKGSRLSYFVIADCDLKGVISKYTELTGKPALPPAWSFGLWLTTSFITNYDEETVTSFIQGMEDRDLPLHVFHFDCYWMKALEWCNFKWDFETFKNPKEMLARYRKRGLKICVWINPYFSQKSPLFKEGTKMGFFIRKKDGSVYQTDYWQPGTAFLDFTNKDAVIWYKEKLKTLLDMGVDCFKTDFGECIPVKGIQYSDGSNPEKMHNYYSYLYNKAVFELLERERGKKDAVLFARSATIGGQKFPVHWGGDCEATYLAMAQTLRGGLSLACSGFGFWSHDIGGFEKTATADLYKRWCAFGLLSSHSRLHGSTSYRVPWLFDEEACDVLRRFIKLKCRLMPYLYGSAVCANENGIPVHRPMFLEFPKDMVCETLDKQYMFGDSILVAPVFRESGEVKFYLPEGKWTNYFTSEIVDGSCFKTEVHSYKTLALYIRENTILPFGKCDNRPDYIFEDGLTIYISYFRDGAKKSITIYDNCGNYAGEVSAYRTKNIISVRATERIVNFNVKLLYRNSATIIKEDDKYIIKL